MCKWGNYVELVVPIPAELSHTGYFIWRAKNIDSCIADIVQALNDAGIFTSSCCCGHGKHDGMITLHDDRYMLLSIHNQQENILLLKE